MSHFTCGNCHEKHETVADVRACYGLAPAKQMTQQQAKDRADLHTDVFGISATPTVALATPKQVAYAMSLQAQRADENDHIGEADYAAMSRKEMSKAIEHLLSLPKRQQAKASTPARETPDGMYLDETDDGDVVYKVYCTRTSGASCVKVLDVTYVDGKAKGSFRYLGLAAKHLPTTAKAMPLDKAKEFGRIYGFCVKCAATLTDETSIASGIGPVCGQDGAWGTVSGTLTLEQPKDDNACTPGEKCQDILSQCSKHAWEYQAKYGRAANE